MKYLLTATGPSKRFNSRISQLIQTGEGLPSARFSISQISIVWLFCICISTNRQSLNCSNCTCNILRNLLIPFKVRVHAVGEPFRMAFGVFVEVDKLEAEALCGLADDGCGLGVDRLCVDVKENDSGFSVGEALRRGHEDDARLVGEAHVLLDEGVELTFVAFLVPVVGLRVVRAEHDNEDLSLALEGDLVELVGGVRVVAFVLERAAADAVVDDLVGIAELLAQAVLPRLLRFSVYARAEGDAVTDAGDVGLSGDDLRGLRDREVF